MPVEPIMGGIRDNKAGFSFGGALVDYILGDLSPNERRHAIVGEYLDGEYIVYCMGGFSWLAMFFGGNNWCFQENHPGGCSASSACTRWGTIREAKRSIEENYLRRLEG